MRPTASYALHLSRDARCGAEQVGKGMNALRKRLLEVDRRRGVPDLGMESKPFVVKMLLCAPPAFLFRVDQ